MLFRSKSHQIKFFYKKLEQFMLNFFQFLTGILIIVLIVPQTPTENIVLRKFLETGFFTNYNEAKSFLNFITWFLIFLFLILTFLISYF